MTARPPPVEESGTRRPQSRALSRAIGQAILGPLNVQARPLLRMAAGTVLLKAGESVSRLPLLLDGRIHTVMHARSPQDPPVLPVSFEAGEMVLLSQLFCDRPSIIDLVAAVPVQMYWIGVSELEELMLRDQAALLLLTRFLGQRLREVQAREQTWIERGAQERVRSLVARLAGQQGPGGADVPVIQMTHDELAARCGLSRPKTSLALKRLEHAGLLRTGRGRIEVLDLAGLLVARSP